jgi:hypothetical protein
MASADAQLILNQAPVDNRVGNAVAELFGPADLYMETAQTARLP